MSASASAADPFLELTGERTLPGIAHENYWFLATEPLCGLPFPA